MGWEQVGNIMGPPGPPGAGGAGAGVIGEVPSGAINSSNTIFTISQPFIPQTLIVYLNGLRQRPTTDFTIVAPNQFALTSPPTTGDSLLTDYYPPPT
jgi:hypothetical protein